MSLRPEGTRDMNRREYLGTVAATVAVAGCTTAVGTSPRTTSSDPPLAVTAPILGPGDSGRITIDARDATSLQVSRVPDVDEWLVEYGAAEFSPPPGTTYQARPPTWVWESPTNVSGEVPVRVPESLTPDDYRYTLVSRRGDDSETVTERFTLTVEG